MVFNKNTMQTDKIGVINLYSSKLGGNFHDNQLNDHVKPLIVIVICRLKLKQYFNILYYFNNKLLYMYMFLHVVPIMFLIVLFV